MKTIHFVAFAIIISLLLFISISYSTEGYSQKTVPKIIWTFWDSNDIPEIVQKCIDTWKRTNPDYIIHIISKNNLELFLPGNDIFSSHHCKDSMQRSSDFIRLNLLYLYGGFWIDASTILNGSLDYFLEIQQRTGCDFLGYYLSGFTTRLEYPVIESWFLVSVPESIIIKLWLQCFSKINKYEDLNTYIDWVKNDQYVDLQNINALIYLTIHVACQHMLQNFLTQEQIQTKIYLEKAEDGPLKYLADNEWDSQKALMNVCKDPSLKTLVLKMRSMERRELLKDEELLCVFN